MSYEEQQFEDGFKAGMLAGILIVFAAGAIVYALVGIFGLGSGQ